MQNPYLTGLTTHEIRSLNQEERELINRVAMQVRLHSTITLMSLIPKFEIMIKRNGNSALAMSKVLLALADEFKAEPSQAALVVAFSRIVAAYSPNAGLQTQAAMDMIAFGSRMRNPEASIEAILAAPEFIPGDMELKRIAAIEACRWLV